MPSFSFASVSAATDNFSDANKLGEGGFGPVYKEWLSINAMLRMRNVYKGLTLINFTLAMLMRTNRHCQFVTASVIIPTLYISSWWPQNWV